MSWRVVTVDDVEARFQAFELATWQNIETGGGEGANLDAKIAAKLTNAVATFIGAMVAADYAVLNDGSVPDQLREDVLAYAAWQWQITFPGQRATEEFKTDPRKQAYDAACKNLEKIRTWLYGNIESPYGQDAVAGNWNSKPKLVMRTDPIPLPVDQWQGGGVAGGPAYANPNAVGDRTRRVLPQMMPPSNLQAQAGDTTVTLSWQWVVGGTAATGYNVYRGTGPGQELATPVATNLQVNYWQDTGLTNGTIYYYQVKAVAGALQSDLSNEVNCTPGVGPGP